MSHGSLQLRRFRIAIRDGYELENAAAYAGIGINEARLTLGSDAADPPPPETYELIGKTMKGHDMAKATKQDQVIKPDFKLAVKYYREDIRPAQAKVGELAQEQSTALQSHKEAGARQSRCGKNGVQAHEMEDDKRDDFLRSLYGLMQELKIGISADLVDQMADGDAPTMPKIESPVSLVTVN